MQGQKAELIIPLELFVWYVVFIPVLLDFCGPEFAVISLKTGGCCWWWWGIKKGLCEKLDKSPFNDAHHMTLFL